MKPLPRSSGDLVADRRADYAEMLFASGDHKAAAELMLGALDIAPEWTLGWFRLGEMHEAAGDAEAAVQAWRMTLRLDPDDQAGAALKLEVAGQVPVSTAPPSAFVEALFDQYARTFDTALVEKLAYRVPELLLTAICRARRERFGRAIDLGCGTGLMGEKLRPFVDDLEGHDISAAMLRNAEAKRVYDRLVKSDLQTVTLQPGSADLFTAADVFTYVGALDRIVTLAAAGLSLGGLVAFSVEWHDGEADFVLRDSRRYAHSRPYVLRVLSGSGLALRSIETADIRKDRGQPIEGLIVVAERV